MKSRIKKMKHSSMNLCCIAIIAYFLLLGMASSTWARDYYVDNGNSNASNNNSGTENAPFATIQKAASVAVAGDTVYVKQGVYRETVNIRNSGSAGNPIVFRAYPGDTPIIDGGGGSGNGLIYGNSKKYIIIDGFEVRNYRDELIYFDYCSNIIIRNCEVHGNANGQNQGIFVTRSSNSLIEYNEVYDVGWNSISVTSCDNVDVEHNYLHDNNKHNGVNVFPKVGTTQYLDSGNDIRYNIIFDCTAASGIYTRFQTNNEIVGNLIYGVTTGYACIKLDGATEPGADVPYPTFAANTKIINNTVISGSYGLRNNNAKNLIVQNNIFINPSKAHVYYGSGLTSGQVLDYNLYYSGIRVTYGGNTYTSLSSLRSGTGKEAHGISANPQFVNASEDNYRLTSSSPAINAGTNVSSDVIVQQDLDGNLRPQGSGYDIGAFEFGSLEVNLLPPQNLRVLQ